MACLAAIFSREFWLCSSHPAVVDFFAFRSKHWQGWHTCRVLVCVSASLWWCWQSFSLFFLYWWCFFVSRHSPSSPHFQEKARTYCSTDGNHYGLRSLSSMFCISYSTGMCAGLRLEDGFLNCWLTWKPCFLASAFVGSVVWDRGYTWAFSSRLSGLGETREVCFSARHEEILGFLLRVLVWSRGGCHVVCHWGRIAEVPRVPGLKRCRAGKCQVPALPCTGRFTCVKCHAGAGPCWVQCAQGRVCVQYCR